MAAPNIPNESKINPSPLRSKHSARNPLDTFVNGNKSGVAGGGKGCNNANCSGAGCRSCSHLSNPQDKLGYSRSMVEMKNSTLSMRDGQKHKINSIDGLNDM